MYVLSYSSSSICRLSHLMRTRNAETRARYEREAVKLARKQRDLKILIGIVHGAARFAQATEQPQWLIDTLYELVGKLDHTQ